jgi:hypothetical protein
MRTAADVRKYSETMLEQGKKYGETMREQGKSSLDEARRFMRAWVGATDLAYDRVRTELKDLKGMPARNRAQVERLQKRARELNRAEVREHARAAYADLAERGEVVIKRLRTHPQARVVFSKPVAAAKPTGKAGDKADQRVTSEAGKAHAEPAHTADRAEGRKLMNGRKPSAHKPSAHKGQAQR